MAQSAKPIRPIRPKVKRDQYGLVDSTVTEAVNADVVPADDPTLFGSADTTERVTPAPVDPISFDEVLQSFLDIPRATVENVGRGFREKGAAGLAGSFVDEVGLPAMLIAAPAMLGVAGKMLGARGAQQAANRSMLLKELELVGDEIDFAKLKGAVPGRGPVPGALRDRLAQLTGRLAGLPEGTSRGTAGVVRSANALVDDPAGSPVERIIGGVTRVLAPRARGLMDIGLGVRDMMRKRRTP